MWLIKKGRSGGEMEQEGLGVCVKGRGILDQIRMWMGPRDWAWDSHTTRDRPVDQSWEDSALPPAVTVPSLEAQPSGAGTLHFYPSLPTHLVSRVPNFPPHKHTHRTLNHWMLQFRSWVFKEYFQTEFSIYAFIRQIFLEYLLSASPWDTAWGRQIWGLLSWTVRTS